MLSGREAVPGLPVWAALSSGHLGAVCCRMGAAPTSPSTAIRPGTRGREVERRAHDAGIAVRAGTRLRDFNDDLRRTARRRCASIWQGRSGQRIGIACQAEHRARRSGTAGQGHESLSRALIVALPLPGQSHPPVTRAAFKRWAGGRQRGRPSATGRLISPAGSRLCIARQISRPRPPPHAFRPRRVKGVPSHGFRSP
jgi:hypothetical protein